jgi:hypothetical protein
MDSVVINNKILKIRQRDGNGRKSLYTELQVRIFNIRLVPVTDSMEEEFFLRS